MGCGASKPSDRKRTASTDTTKASEKLATANEGRQEGQVAQVHATTLLHDDGQPPPAVGLRKTYGPDGYELVGQLGAGKTGTMKLMRNRRTKELVVARCIPHSATGASTFLLVQIVHVDLRDPDEYIHALTWIVTCGQFPMYFHCQFILLPQLQCCTMLCIGWFAVCFPRLQTLVHSIVPQTSSGGRGVRLGTL